MSYILDALQKSDAAANPVEVTSARPAPNSGLALPWKLAIGAVLFANLILLYLWRTDRAATPTRPQPAAVAVPEANRPPEPRPLPMGATPQTRQPKKVLPGIASPRPLPPPGATNSQPRVTAPAVAGTRTFKPRGTPITIAEGTNQQRKPASPTPQPTASRLSQLSDSAREALYVLSFSTHIYGSDRDLRAVVVNGQRLTEGNSVTAANGQEFLLLEITDSGVIIQFDHEGTTRNVEIPVMEDWKDS